MRWTTPAELKAQVEKLWARGKLLTALAGDEPLFPRRLALKTPNSRDLSEHFAEVRDWIELLQRSAKDYRIEWRSVNHRIVGNNQIPAAIWIDRLEDALKLIGKQRAAERFTSLLTLTQNQQPALLPWLSKYPLRALALADDWPRLLTITAWIEKHPRPAIYLRQMDLSGVHSKMIERHRGVLSEWLELILPEEAIDHRFSGTGGFSRRYGFLDKPARVRFRLLDANIRLLPGTSEQDITLTQSALASLALPVSKVFITENEINFLAFPEAADAMVIFGAGYGFDNLAAIPWLHEKTLYYWGDIDTHGFAILDQLRAHFPHAVSLLMDEQTLLSHKPLWGRESRPETRRLERLTGEENTLYEQLRDNRWGENVRLEQEHIGFEFMRQRLHAVIASN